MRKSYKSEKLVSDSENFKSPDKRLSKDTMLERASNSSRDSWFSANQGKNVQIKVVKILDHKQIIDKLEQKLRKQVKERLRLKNINSELVKSRTNLSPAASLSFADSAQAKSSIQNNMEIYDHKLL